jgi:hypothetical protein
VGVPARDLFVKTAAAAAGSDVESGKVVETVTRKRVVPASEISDQSRDAGRPDFWEYLEKLTPADWEKHCLYLYRRDAESGPTPQLEKSFGTITVDGALVPLTGREETEYAIVQKYGGGTYRLILKRGHERVCEGRVFGEGPRKNPPPSASSVYGNGSGTVGDGLTVTAEGDPMANVANHAITTIAGQERLAVDVGVRAMTSAADVIQRLSHRPPASETDDLLKLALAKMLERAMQPPPPPPPPPDPLDMLTKFLALANQLNGGGAAAAAAAGGSPLVQKILDAALERILNPEPAGPASENAGAELVRQLPMVANFVARSFSDWRGGMEAQRDTAVLMRGGVPAPPNKLPPSPPPAAAPAATSTEGQIVAPSLEFIEGKIVELLREPGSADEAADRTVVMLDTLHPPMVEQLKSLGESGLMNLFQTRPMLRPALQNLARLQEFIRAFLKYANDGGEPEVQPAAKPI